MDSGIYEYHNNPGGLIPQREASLKFIQSPTQTSIGTDQTDNPHHHSIVTVVSEKAADTTQHRFRFQILQIKIEE